MTPSTTGCAAKTWRRSPARADLVDGRPAFMTALASIAS